MEEQSKVRLGELNFLCLMSNRNRGNEHRTKRIMDSNSNTSGRRNENEKGRGWQRKKTTQDITRQENDIQMLHQL